jgi:hypothetical protein
MECFEPTPATHVVPLRDNQQEYNMKFILAAATATLIMTGSAMAQNTNSPVQQPDGTGTTGAALTQPDTSGTNKPNSPLQKVDAPTTVPNNQDLPTSTGQDAKKGTNLGQ